MQKIIPFIWFEKRAEEAARFYVLLFKNSKIEHVTRYGAAAAKASGRAKGSVMTVQFRLAGQRFIALNGGPHVKLNEAFSMMVYCRTQKEIDWFWKKLSAGGKEVQCGWLKDRFGLFWQIVPEQLMDMLGRGDGARTDRIMQAVLQMRKLDLSKLKAAWRK